jgi:hypothetical protein
MFKHTIGTKNMTQILIIEKKQVYGNEVFYPVNDQAKLFAKIANTKTLLRSTILTAKELGYTIEVKQPETTF